MVITRNTSLQTRGECDIIDITTDVQQKLVVVDFEHRPRSRQILLQIMGE
jgi:thiamine phosphate synthase YjbQ (UPF0047 family)